MLPPFKTANQLTKELQQTLLDSLPPELKELCETQSFHFYGNESENENKKSKEIEYCFSKEIGETLDSKLVTLCIFSNKLRVILSYLDPRESAAGKTGLISSYDNFEYEEEIVSDFKYNSDNYLEVYTNMVNFLNPKLIEIYP